MSAVIYARASTKEQAKSCDSQIRECTAKAKALGLKVLNTYKDDGISGARTDRPAYQSMLAAAETKSFETLLVFDQSRLGRDSVEAERAMRRLEFHGLRLVTCDGYDTNNMPLKLRKMTRGMKGIMNEAYLDDLKELTHRGQHDQFLKGYWVGGRPYGYKLVAVTDPKRCDAHGNPERIGTLLRPDPVDGKIVVEIFVRYGNGESPQAIAGDLNERKVPSPGSRWKRKVRRCSGWSRSAIWQILQNPLYSGTYFWNRSVWVKDETGKRVARSHKEAARVGEVGNKPEWAIVTAAVWKRAQARLNANAGKPKDKRLQSGGKAVYLLSGQLYCGVCSANFVMDSATHYRCGKALDGKGCTNTIRVRRDVAEREIMKPITEQLLAPAMVEEMAKEMRQHYSKLQAKRDATSAQLPAEVATIDARLKRLRERLAGGDPDMDQDELQAVIDSAQAKRAALVASQPGAQRTAKVLAALPAAAASYRAQLAKGMHGNPAEAGRARLALRQLLGSRINLKPAGGGQRHLIARFGLQRVALLGQNYAAGSVGSGGRI